MATRSRSNSGSKPKGPFAANNPNYSTIIITNPIPQTNPPDNSNQNPAGAITPTFAAPSPTNSTPAPVINTPQTTAIISNSSKKKSNSSISSNISLEGIEVPPFTLVETNNRITKAKYVRIITQEYEIDKKDGNPPDACYREFIHLRKMSATILPMCPSENKFLLIRQFRYPAWYNANQDNTKNSSQINEESWLYETIAGVIEPGDTPEETAIKEAQEEGNITINPSNLRLVHKAMMTPGITNEEMSFYLAIVPKTSADGPAGLASEGEFIRAKWMTPEEIKSLNSKGLIRDCKTLIMLYAAKIL